MEHLGQAAEFGFTVNSIASLIADCEAAEKMIAPLAKPSPRDRTIWRL